MGNASVRLGDLAAFLGDFLETWRFHDPGGICRESERLVGRLGLALEPWPRLDTWAEDERLDALWLHRHWNLPSEGLGDVGVLAHHHPFDEKLTTGYNLRLAEALGMTDVQVLGLKEGRPIGMLGAVPPQDFARFSRVVTEEFGGSEDTRYPVNGEVRCVAVVGAMTDALVREASERGVHVYVTGQWRQPAARAVDELGIGVIAVGHRRTEEWGLYALAALLEERWAELACVLAPDHRP